MSPGDGSQILAPAEWLPDLVIGLGVSGVLAVLAYRLRAFAASGCTAGAAVGGAVWAGAGAAGFGMLAAFVILAVAATRAGYARKEALGVAQADEGRRGAWHVLANGGVAAACAILSLWRPDSLALTAALTGSLAAATADTLESEIGQAWGRPTVLLTSLRPVAPGTDGAISPQGTTAGLAGACGVALVGAVGGLVSWPVALTCGAAGWAATLVESLVGATLERRGVVGNHAVNWINTSLGAVLASALV